MARLVRTLRVRRGAPCRMSAGLTPAALAGFVAPGPYAVHAARRATSQSLNVRSHEPLTRGPLMRYAQSLPVLLVTAVPALAQTPVESRPQCERCTLTLEPSAVISGEHVIGAPMAIARTRQGGYVVSFYPRGDEVLSFDSSGQFLQVLARRGRGPGEVTRAGHAETSIGDSLRIYDNGRVLIYGPELDFVRTETLPLPAARDAVTLVSGTTIIAVPTFMSDFGGSPLYIVEQGEVKKAFGRTAGEPVGNPGSPFAIVRSLATDADNRIWSAPLTRYEIAQWDTTGAATGSWSVSTDAFRPWSELRPLGPNQPPDPRVSDIHWLGDDRLLVILAVPNPDWRDHLGPPSTGPQGAEYNEADINRMFHTRLDVWNLSEAAILVFSSGAAVDNARG